MKGLHNQLDFDNMTRAVEEAYKGGYGLVIVEAPYCNSPRAWAGNTWRFNQYYPWKDVFGIYPYAYNPYN